MIIHGHTTAKLQPTYKITLQLATTLMYTLQQFRSISQLHFMRRLQCPYLTVVSWASTHSWVIKLPCNHINFCGVNIYNTFYYKFILCTWVSSAKHQLG